MLYRHLYAAHRSYRYQGPSKVAIGRQKMKPFPISTAGGTLDQGWSDFLTAVFISGLSFKCLAHCFSNVQLSAALPINASGCGESSVSSWQCSCLFDHLQALRKDVEVCVVRPRGLQPRLGSSSVERKRCEGRTFPDQHVPLPPEGWK